MCKCVVDVDVYGDMCRKCRCMSVDVEGHMYRCEYAELYM